MNNITLLGRLTANPTLKSTSKTKYTQFTTAVDRVKSDGVDFIDCVAFGKLAEALANNCEKGRQLLINGRLQVSQNKGRNYYSVISNQITFLQRPRQKAKSEDQKTVAEGGKPF